METEINKNKIDNKLDILLQISLLWHKLYDGWTCDKCQIIQGEPRKGFERYYCKHVSESIDRKLRPIEKRLTNEIVFNVKQSTKLGSEMK